MIKKGDSEGIENGGKNEEKIFDVTVGNSEDLDVDRLRDRQVVVGFDGHWAAL
jgi:hypothetical protein